MCTNDISWFLDLYYSKFKNNWTNTWKKRRQLKWEVPFTTITLYFSTDSVCFTSCFSYIVFGIFQVLFPVQWFIIYQYFATSFDLLKSYLWQMIGFQALSFSIPLWFIWLSFIWLCFLGFTCNVIKKFWRT